MQAEEFIERVHLREPVADEETAGRATHATLRALGGVLRADEARALAAQLPAGLSEAVTLTADQPGPADPEELYLLVADRAAIEPELAAKYANAVVGVLHKAVSEGEFTNVVMDLPPEFDELVVI